MDLMGCLASRVIMVSQVWTAVMGYRVLKVQLETLVASAHLVIAHISVTAGYI